MRLQEYWGVGPKTADLLETELGVDRAVGAIESADVAALVEAGLSRGRATRILRRATGAAGLGTLGTGDARDVYGDLLELAASDALTDGAADRIRVLTPLETQEAAEERLDRIDAARAAWGGLGEDDRDAVVDAFTTYDETGAGRRAAVEAALDLRAIGADEGGPFDRLAELDADALAEAVDALGAVEGEFSGGVDGGPLSVGVGADERLDELRTQLSAAQRLNDAALDVLETVRGQGVRSLEEFQSAVIAYVAEETGVTTGEIRAVAPDEARDETDFVSATLRALVADLEGQVADREAAVAGDLRETLDEAGEGVEDAVSAVDALAFDLSLARFAETHALTRPTLVADGLAVRGARNPFLGGDIQPITYGVGNHSVTGGARATDPPSGDRVAVLTGANSGGKTTLLETLCAVALLAAMGLPVPAEEAEVGRFDAVVFHRRHASFNAGVLESTLRSVVPPLTGEGRALMLVDEFEAITEPGRAADLLNGLVDLTVDRDALGVFVTHLADDLSPLPDTARIDGIFAEGLTEELDLRVDYQPRFGTVGRSTPEFIVSRLVANSSDRDERAAFRSIASSIGEEAVQRTLSDAEWSG
ncbi:MAG: MutS-related protein [Halolamina sp.]